MGQLLRVYFCPRVRRYRCPSFRCPSFRSQRLACNKHTSLSTDQGLSGRERWVHLQAPGAKWGRILPYGRCAAPTAADRCSLTSARTERAPLVLYALARLERSVQMPPISPEDRYLKCRTVLCKLVK